VRAFLPNPEPLFEIADQSAAGGILQSAAAMMYLLHPNHASAHDARCQEIIVSNYRQEHGSWYLAAAALSLGDITPESSGVMNQLLQNAAIDFEGRMRLDPVLESWRQKSKAPVNTGANPDLWT